MHNKGLKKKLGQNTAEYLIMLTLVAVGSIGLVTAFGKTIHTKLAYLSAAISGDTALYTAAQGLNRGAATAANAKAAEADNIKMEGISSDELSSDAITGVD